MRLYHLLILTSFFLLLAACSAPQVVQSSIAVQVMADGKMAALTLPAGSTVEEAFDAAGVSVGSADRSEPPFYTVLTDGAEARLIRVEERLDPAVQEIIPYERLMVRSESLPEGEMLLTQRGVNGMQQKTVRRVYEDGVEVNTIEMEPAILKTPVPEIVVVGIQRSFEPMVIPGRIAYLLGGNAWVMDGNTGKRRPVVKTGDLDGRIFSISPDGEWLLFTRRTEDEGGINTLWAARVDENRSEELDLQAANVIHFADWAPGTLMIAYSTVEPRTAAPGWQANNDLNLVAISSEGFVSTHSQVVETNSGGVYGWWGTMFGWAVDASRLAYATPDRVGTLTREEGLLTSNIDLIPLSTGSDWAWVPGIAWSPDGNVVYTVEHVVQVGSASPEESPEFALMAIPQAGGAPVRLATDVGMFAYPEPSPFLNQPERDKSYQVAYLRAEEPFQSKTSLYRLMVMDRDGSDRRELFPPAESIGLKPQRVAWSPEAVREIDSFGILLLYHGNLWLVSAASGEAWQLTGDGLTSRISWR